jgi:hypothetical protein
MVAFNDVPDAIKMVRPIPEVAPAARDSSGYRCYGTMDQRGRWDSWLFAPAIPAQTAILVAEAARRKQVLFLSVQTFAPPPAGVPVRRWKRVREHYVGDGARPHLTPLYFDIDCAGDLDQALLAARCLVEFLLDELGLTETAVRIWFSGSKGLHILVHPAALGLTPSASLTQDMKQVVAVLVKRLEAEGGPELLVDSAVYSMPRMLRAPNQINPKSGLYKTELTHGELRRLSADEIKNLARQPRRPWWANDNSTPPLSPKAAAWWSTELARLHERHDFTRRTAELTGRKVRPDGFTVDDLVSRDMPDCIRRLAEAPVGPGARNRAELQLACWSLAAGRSQTWATNLLAAWATRNRPELAVEGGRAKAESVVKAVYGRAGYGFSCTAARAALRAAGLDQDCGRCLAVRQPALRTLHSLRQSHDEGWTAPERITLHDARTRSAGVIDHFVASAAGPHAARNRQDTDQPARPGHPRRAGRLRHADAPVGGAGTA